MSDRHRVVLHMYVICSYFLIITDIYIYINQVYLSKTYTPMCKNNYDSTILKHVPVVLVVSFHRKRISSLHLCLSLVVAKARSFSLPRHDSLRPRRHFFRSIA